MLEVAETIFELGLFFPSAFKLHEYMSFGFESGLQPPYDLKSYLALTLFIAIYSAFYSLMTSAAGIFSSSGLYSN